ncbi:hypothetical protein F5878DRAFT_613000 [Lentinula raphanica]|uniref:Mid2 domain-containing protein n=1 Tax=Lentinula raphanica TaxID=153919 RepID=A0AA38PCR4_9AGAR|nr:hypothetical protein F5878DRAFT_613000 [Lentinula raphanica]
MFLLFCLLSILSWGPQAALSSIKLNISQVTECEPVFISFLGHFNSSLQQVPLSLQILPFNSTPSLIPLPSYTANSTGVNVTFLPIPANTEFIATVSSPSGSISSVSDIFDVNVASPRNTACLPQTTFTPSFEIQDPANLSQCEDFAVTYSGRSPPIVELFNPRGQAYPLNITSSLNNTATYNLAAIRQSQIILNFIATDGGQNQTSPLLTVQGDAFSSTACFPKSNHTDQNTSQSKSDTKSPGISKGTIIGLSVGLGAVVLLAIPMGWLVIRERRRRRRVISTIDFDGSRMERQPSPYLPTTKEKGPVPPPPFFGYPGYTEGRYVKDPIYVSEKYSPTISDYPRTSISWEYIRRNSTERQSRTQNLPENLHRSLRASLQSANLLSSSNIEKMLNIAATGGTSVDVSGLHSPRSARSNDSYEVLPVSPPPALHPSTTMSLRDRAAPDVPHNPPSFFADSSILAEQSDKPLSESPESMGSILRPESGTLSPITPEAMQNSFALVQPQRAVLVGVPPSVRTSQPRRSPSPRTVSRENSMAKLVGLGSRRTASHGSRFSMNSSVDGRF